ncbi:MAG: 2-polyprenyl-3-methyl-6-methoxy-1,4-benzoquinone monooxygenase [Legionellales bacterium]|nr:2-polyprenyl-3-methyl-6-methoxy-1,4-benzoquinone monooxygenase [Legionellales bacterium]
MSMQPLSLIDTVIIQFDQGLRTLFGDQRQVNRPYPAEQVANIPLTATEKTHIGGLMRVNHAGEICAQALYQGQALTAQLTHVCEQMEQAAEEEEEHLAWCEQRLAEINAHVSYLNPIWFLGAFTMGAVAGWCGDRWSLGFVVETENQVVRHLQDHIRRLPVHEQRTRVILQQMQEDEAHHAQQAMDAGAQQFPHWIKQIMHTLSKVMTSTAYYV